MNYRILMAIVLTVVFLYGCSCVIPCYVLNETEETLVLSYEGSSHTIKSGKTKKVRGLYYRDFVVTFESGAKKSYSHEKLAILKDWQNYLDKYICSTSWGSRIDLKINEASELVLLPCNKEYKRKTIPYDNLH